VATTTNIFGEDNSTDQKHRY